MYLYPSVPSTDPVYLIKDNKIVGEGTIAVRKGDDYVAVSVRSGEIFDKVKETESYKLLGKHTTVRFMPFTGSFLESGFTDAQDLDQLFEYVRVVDQFNFDYGLASDTFKDVEGFRSKLNEANRS